MADKTEVAHAAAEHEAAPAKEVAEESQKESAESKKDKTDDPVPATELKELDIKDESQHPSEKVVEANLAKDEPPKEEASKE